jgi:transposase
MVSPELEGHILRLHHVERWKVGTIAQELGIHHSVVRRVLAQNGVAPGRLYMVRPSVIDPFMAFINETLDKYPKLRASRLYEMVRERGYPGGPDHFRHMIALVRPPPPAEAYLHLRTLPGEQAQVDWAHFGTLTLGRAERRLSAFVMVLSWSRMIFLRFYLSQKFPYFLHGHVEAFTFFGGVTRISLYDNLKSAVLERIADAIRFNPRLLQFAGHYRYEPRPVAPYRGNEKGRVESAIRYIRYSFFAARPWTDLDDLNAQALAWCQGAAAARRCRAEPSLTVGEAFEQERSKLLSLPDAPFPTDEQIAARVGKFPYARFDLNDYSLPHTHVRKTVSVVASLDTVRILDGTKEIARHPRSFDKGQRIEDPAHLADLVEAKRRARKHRAIDRLRHAAPSSQQLLNELAQAGLNLGGATVALLRLLDLYGAQELESAIAQALRKDSPHPHSVRHILQRRRRDRGQPPPVPVELPPEARDKDWSIHTHDLNTYDQLGDDDPETSDKDKPAEESDDEETDDEQR